MSELHYEGNDQLNRRGRGSKVNSYQSSYNSRVPNKTNDTDNCAI